MILGFAYPLSYGQRGVSFEILGPWFCHRTLGRILCHPRLDPFKALQHRIWRMAR